MLDVYFTFVHSLSFQLFTLFFLHLCHLFPPLPLHLLLAFLNSKAAFNSRNKLTCRLVMPECIRRIDYAIKLVMILSAIWWCKVSSALSPTTMTSLFSMILIHSHIYPIIVSSSLSFLCHLVLYESIDESLLVEAGSCTVILQALRLPVFHFFDVWFVLAIILSHILVFSRVVVSIHTLFQFLSMLKIRLKQALLRLLILYQFLVTLYFLFLFFQE